jgi:Fe-S cluster assembly protein SufD
MDLNRYLESFEKAAEDPAWLADFRRQGLEYFRQKGLPSFRDEDWKYTSLSKFSKLVFTPGAGLPVSKMASIRTRLDQISFKGSHRIVFVDGKFQSELSEKIEQPGLTISSLAEALGRPEVQSILQEDGNVPDGPKDGLKALNASFFTDGPYIHVKKGAMIAPVIHLVYVSSQGEATSEAPASHLRGLIELEAGAQAKIAESFIGMDDELAMTNVRTWVELGDDALLEHVKIQDEGLGTYHFGDLRVRQGKKSSFRSTLLSLGAALGRSEIWVRFEGEGAECSLDGVYAARGEQHVDCLTLIDHAVAGCCSHETYKGILDGSARGVFSGKVLVREHAQKTSAEQSNQNLLLSESAIANTRPQLQIYADDVKCTHGATVGRLDENSLFYLRSRGIAPSEARVLLTQAFAAEVLDRVQAPSLKEALKGRFRQWLS